MRIIEKEGTRKARKISKGREKDHRDGESREADATTEQRWHFEGVVRMQDQV